jgi:histidinol-phosphate aminotransferase
VSRLGGNWIAQKGAIAAYRTKEVWRPKVVSISRRNQQMLRETLDLVPGLRALVYPSSGNFIAVDVTGSGRSAEDIVNIALAAGFVIRSGGYTSPRFGERFVRITTTVPVADMTRFCEALPALLGDSQTHLAKVEAA